MLIFAPRRPQRFGIEGRGVGGGEAYRPALRIFGTRSGGSDGTNQGRLEAGVGWYCKGANRCSKGAEAEADPG